MMTLQVRSLTTEENFGIAPVLAFEDALKRKTRAPAKQTLAPLMAITAPDPSLCLKAGQPVPPDGSYSTGPSTGDTLLPIIVIFLVSVTTGYLVIRWLERRERNKKNQQGIEK